MKRTITAGKIKLAKDPGPAVNFERQPLLAKGVGEGGFARLERRFLARVLEYSNHCMRPEKKVVSETQERRRPNFAYVSTVSLSLNYGSAASSRPSHYEFVDNDPYRHLTYSDDISIQEFERLALGSIEMACNAVQSDEDAGNSPHVIVVNEFGFPFYRRSAARDAFLKRLVLTAQKENAYIVPGSSHCFQTKKNLSYLVAPGSSAVHEVPKFSPAISLGEKIVWRDTLKWQYFRTAIGNVAVLICFDLIDPSVFLRLTYMYRDFSESERIHLFLVPCFSPNDEVREQAELLSYLTKSIVVYVNYQYDQDVNSSDNPLQGSPRAESHGIFICGVDASDRDALAEACWSDLFLPISSQTFRPERGKAHVWSSIETGRLRYRDTINSIGEQRNKFSDLLSEILSLAKNDPGTRR